MKAKLVKESLSEGRYDKNDETPRFSQMGPNYNPDMRNWYEKSKNRIQEPIVKTPKERAPRKKYPAPIWNKAKYNKWVKEMSWYEGDEVPGDYGYEMAQNAIFVGGLIDYVRNIIKREGGYEHPLERIQWDIEAYL